VGYFEEQLNSDEYFRDLQQLIASISGWLENNDFLNKKIKQQLENVDGLLKKKRMYFSLQSFQEVNLNSLTQPFSGCQGKNYYLQHPVKPVIVLR